MKKIISMALALVMLFAIIATVTSCNLFGQNLKGHTGNGIHKIITDKIDGGTKVRIIFTDTSKEDVVFIIPDGEQGVQGEKGEKGDQGEQGIQGEKGDQGEQGIQGETGRGILKAEIIDGYLWITYTDSPYTPVNIGRVTPGETTSEETTPEETTPDPDAVEMPDKINLNGYTYKAYVRDLAGTSPDAYNAQLANGNNDYRCIDFWVDQANSETDAISYAVYNRNKQVESDYNCKIRQVASDGSQIEHLLAAYTNGDGYDLTIIMARAAAQAATQNLLRNLNNSQYLDLSHDSFDQNSIKELSVGNKLYFVSGDMNISTMDVAGATIVNMEFYEKISDTIIEAFGDDASYSNIYNIVLENKWTMDTLLTIAEIANVDAGNDGGGLHVLPNGTNGGTIVDNKYSGGDVVGYHQYLYSALWYFYGSGGRITAKNDDGIPQFVIQNATGQTLYDYIFEHFNRKVGANTWIPHESSAILNMNFLTGDVLFADCSLFNVRKEIYPKAEFEYGILPVPVYEEGMQYKSVVYFNNWAHLWAIPSLVNNEENAFIMMQVMAAYSSTKDSTMYAYYDRTVYLQAAADNGSRKAMDIIKNSMVYDIALLYAARDWGNIETNLIQIPNEETSKYASMAESINSGRLDNILMSTIEMLLYPDRNW